MVPLKPPAMEGAAGGTGEGRSHAGSCWGTLDSVVIFSPSSRLLPNLINLAADSAQRVNIGKWYLIFRPFSGLILFIACVQGKTFWATKKKMCKYCLLSDESKVASVHILIYVFVTCFILQNEISLHCCLLK